MMLNAITLLFKEVHDTFPPIKEKPTDDDLLSIKDTLLSILMEISYNQIGGVHSLRGLLTDPARYTANHGATFICPICLPLYNGSIAYDATTVVCVSAGSAHKAGLDDFASYTAESGAAKFLRGSVNEVWYKNLKDADTLYPMVLALKIMTFIEVSSRGLHAIDMISLCTNMHQYYLQGDGILQYIAMLEDPQKRQSVRTCPSPTLSLS
jgi:hypothetical protein